MRLLEAKDEGLFFQQRQGQRSIGIDIVDVIGAKVQNFIDVHDNCLFIHPVDSATGTKAGLSSMMGAFPTVYIYKNGDWQQLIEKPVIEATPSVYPLEGLTPPPIKEAA